MDFSFLFEKYIFPFFHFIGTVVMCVYIPILIYILFTMIKNRLNPFKLNRAKLVKLKTRLKITDFVRWLLIDVIDAPENRSKFRESGLTLFCGRQGSGKTISMVYYLWKIKRRYPDCIIVANFKCKFVDHVMKDWNDFFEYRNGEKGVVFAIDEIHSEYSSSSWKDFPEDLLSEISQQRKQRIKIVASSQIFTRVVKPLREQAMTVVICKTVAGRWTFNREYDAVDMQVLYDNPAKKIRSLRRSSFVQSDLMRAAYDTYEKIVRMRNKEFIPRHERGA